METPTQKHRHFIALPIAIAVLALSVADAQVGISRMVSSVSALLQAEHDERFTFDNGVFGIVYAGGELEREGRALNVLNGSVALVTDGVLHASVGSYRVTSMNGAIHLTRGSSSVTVAAITAPAFIEAGDQRMIVPVGMQWEGNGNDIAPLNDGFKTWMKERLARPLPTHFIERVLSDLSVVRVPSSVLPESQALLPVDLVSEEEVLLPISKEKALADRYEHVLGTVRHAVEQGDMERVEALFADDGVKAAIATPRGQEVVAVLLQAIAESQTMLRMALLQQLIVHENLWMVATFHPEYRDMAWAAFEPDVSAEAHLTRVFLVPFSFFGSDAFTEFTMERFAVALRGMVKQVGEPVSFVEHLIETHMPLIDRLESRGYPQRAAFLAENLEELIHTFDEPTAYMRDALTQLRQRNAVSLDPLPQRKERKHEEEVIHPAPEPVVQLSEEETEALGYSMLQKSGALFTVNTAVSAGGQNIVHVTDVLYGSSTVDRSVSFTLNVVTKIVSHIEIDGNTDFPYEPTFDGFVTWIRK